MVLQNSLPNNDLGNSVRQYGARQFNSFTSSELSRSPHPRARLAIRIGLVRILAGYGRVLLFVRSQSGIGFASKKALKSPSIVRAIS
jgi:hypothetical protein